MDALDDINQNMALVALIVAANNMLHVMPKLLPTAALQGMASVRYAGILVSIFTAIPGWKTLHILFPRHVITLAYSRLITILTPSHRFQVLFATKFFNQLK